MSLAIILFSVPHFFLEDYNVKGYDDISNETNNSTNLETLSVMKTSMWVIHLILMSFIASAASLPLYTIGK